MDINGRTLQVDGTLPGTGTVDATGNSTLISSSAIDFSTFILNSDQTTSITFQTAGTISNLPALTDLNNLVLNRAGITLTLSGPLHLHSNLSISAGTISNEYDLQIDGTTTVNGTLNMNHALAANRTLTFGSTLSGTGTIRALPTASYLSVYIHGAYSFTNASVAFSTNANVDLYVAGTSGNNFTMDASITDLRTLTIQSNPGRIVQLSSDLEITTGGLVFANSGSNELQVNGNTLTLQSNYAPPASGGVLVAGNNANSIVVFNGNADFTNGTLLTDCTTTLQFDADVSAYPAGANNLYNLTVSGAFAFPAANFNTCNNLTVNAASVVTTSANRTITITNNFTMNGTFNATNITGLSIGGDLITSGLETWNNYANIDLSVVASTALFSLPNAITQLRRITLNRANGMKINADLTLGEDALGNPYNGTVLSINNGDFDLNGFNTTLATLIMSFTRVLQADKLSSIPVQMVLILQLVWLVRQLHRLSIVALELANY